MKPDRSLSRLILESSALLVLSLAVSCSNDIDLSPQPAPPITNAPAVAPPAPIEAFTLPSGEVLAHLSRDLSDAKSQPISSGKGNWQILVTRRLNPWFAESAPQPMALENVGNGAAKFASSDFSVADSASGAKVAFPQIASNASGVDITTDQRCPSFALLRWNSTVTENITIKLRISRQHSPRTMPLMATVIVDGAPVLTRALANTDLKSVELESFARLKDKSVVDLIVGYDCTASSSEPFVSGGADILKVDMAIVHSSLAPDAPSEEELTAAVAEKMKIGAKRPLPALAAITEDPLASFLRRQVRDQLKVVHQLSDADAAKAAPFLDHVINSFANQPWETPDPALLNEPILRQLYDTDPLFHFSAEFLKWRVRNVIVGPMIVHLAQNPNVPEALQGYPPFARAFFYYLAAQRIKRDMNPDAFAELLAKLERRCARELVAAIEAPINEEEDRQQLRAFALTTMQNAMSQAYLAELIAGIHNSKNADPWCKATVLGNYRLLSSGLTALHSRRVSDNEAAIRISRQLRREGASLGVTAWRLKPQLPDGALLVLGAFEPEGELYGTLGRFWFDEAVAARGTYDWAITTFFEYLDNRTDESDQSYMDFGREFLNSGKIDSGLPAKYLSAQYRLLSRDHDWEEVSHWPGVLDDLKSLANQDKLSNEMADESDLLAIDFFSGDMESCEKHFQSLGENIDWDRLLRFSITPNTLARYLELGKHEARIREKDGTKPVDGVFSDASGEQLILARGAGVLERWDPKKREKLGQLDLKAPFLQLVTSPSRDAIAIQQKEGKIKAGLLRGFAANKQIVIEGAITALAISNAAKWLAVCHVVDSKSRISIYELDNSTTAKLVLPNDVEAPFQQLAFADKANRLLGARFSRQPHAQAVVWNLDSASLEMKCRPFALAACSAAISSDGSNVVVQGTHGASSLGGRNLWGMVCRKLTGPEPVWKSDSELLTRCLELHFTRDGKEIMGGSRDGMIHRWNAQTGATLESRQTPWRRIKSTVEFRDGYIAALDSFGRVFVGEAAPANEMTHVEGSLTLTKFIGPILRTDLLANGDLVVVDSRPSVSIWTAESSHQKCRKYLIPNPNDAAFRVAPSGDFMASLTPSRQIQVTDLASGKVLSGWNPEPNVETSTLAITNDGQVLIQGDTLGRVRLWRNWTKSPELWAELMPRPTVITKLALSLDDKVLAVAADNMAWLFDMPADPRPRKSPMQHRFEFPNLIEGIRGFAIASDNRFVNISGRNYSFFIDIQAPNPMRQAAGSCILSSQGANMVSLQDISFLANQPMPSKIVLVDSASQQPYGEINLPRNAAPVVGACDDARKLIFTGDEEGWITISTITARLPTP